MAPRPLGRAIVYQGRGRRLLLLVRPRLADPSQPVRGRRLPCLCLQMLHVSRRSSPGAAMIPVRFCVETREGLACADI
jgi:hypothetical protein